MAAVDSLDNFITYLAQACECESTLQLTADELGCFGSREQPEVRTLLVCRVTSASAGHWQALAAAQRQAAIALLILQNSEPEQVRQAAKTAGINFEFVGTAPNRSQDVIVVIRHGDAPESPPPPGFRALVILPVYNEEDIIRQTLVDILAQGLHCYVLDNWSTDRTVEIATEMLGDGVVGIERFPPDAPPADYALREILSRVEQIALEQSWADWIILHDADERRRSPWLGKSLRDAIWKVNEDGYNCIDHVTLTFHVTREDEIDNRASQDVEERFKYFEFSAHEGHFHQRKCWKNLGIKVALADNAGHDCWFPGRKVHPFKFLLKHYPVRCDRRSTESAKLSASVWRGSREMNARRDGTSNTMIWAQAL